MRPDVYQYIAVMAVCTFLIRVLPLTLIRKEITNPTIRSFLYYVPYVPLAVMTFPAIIEATQSPAAGLLALLVGVVLAWRGTSMFLISGLCCVTVFLAELMIP